MTQATDVAQKFVCKYLGRIPYGLVMADENVITMNGIDGPRRASCLDDFQLSLTVPTMALAFRDCNTPMKNQRCKSPGSHPFIKVLAASFVSVWLCSCTSTVYDMRQLDQPVVLNNNPFLLSGTAASPKTVNVNTYSANIFNPQDQVNSDGTVTTSTTNTAQLNAFLKIGGEPNYFIHNVSLDLTGVSLNIEANGEVAQIQPPLPQPPGLAGQSPTNQSVLPSTDQK